MEGVSFIGTGLALWKTGIKKKYFRDNTKGKGDIENGSVKRAQVSQATNGGNNAG